MREPRDSPRPMLETQDWEQEQERERLHLEATPPNTTNFTFLPP